MLKGLFDPDGVFARAMDWVGRMVLLNVLFLAAMLVLAWLLGAI
mgnify:CR=1 FL=1